jgi:hypothetical protein
MNFKKVKTLQILEKNSLQNSLITFWNFEYHVFSTLLYFDATLKNHAIKIEIFTFA